MEDVLVVILLVVLFLLFVSLYPVSGFVVTSLLCAIGVLFVLFGSATSSGGRDVMFSVTGHELGVAIMVVMLPYLLLSYFSWKWLDAHDIKYYQRVVVVSVVYVVIPVTVGAIAGYTYQYVGDLNRASRVENDRLCDLLLQAINSNNASEIAEIKKSLGKVEWWKANGMAANVVEKKTVSPQILLGLSKSYPVLARAIFVNAVRKNEIEYINALVERVGDLNKVINPETDDYPVIIDVKSREVFHVLVNHGARLDARCFPNDYGRKTTVLYMLVLKSKVNDTVVSEDDLVSTVQASHVDVAALSDGYKSLLSILARRKLYRLVDELVRQGMELDKWALLEADNREEVEYLLRLGVPVDAGKGHGITALLSAASRSTPDMEIVSALIDNGADINAKNDQGMTALMLAANNNGNPEAMIDYLISHGAMTDAKSNMGKTAWDYLQSSDFYSYSKDGVIKNKLKAQLQN